MPRRVTSTVVRSSTICSRSRSPGNHHGLLAGFFGLTRERRDDVVGFLTLDFDDRNVERLQYFAYERKLTAQFVGHRTALRFVFGKELDALRRHAFIEGRQHVRRLFFGDEFVQHHRESRKPH